MAQKMNPKSGSSGSKQGGTVGQYLPTRPGGGRNSGKSHSSQNTGSAKKGNC